MKVSDRFIFRTPHDQHKRLDGLPCRIVRVIDKADATHDAEVLPMYEVRFTDRKFRHIMIEVWPDELSETLPTIHVRP